MKETCVGVLVLLLLTFGAVTSGMAESAGEFGRPTKEQVERVWKRIETLRMWKLTKALDLDEDTAARIFPLLNRYDKERFEIKQAMREDMAALRKALEDKRKDRLQEILGRIERNRKRLQRLNDDSRAELKKILTIEQQARFVIFQQEFNREIRRIIKRAREQRRERLQ